MDLQGNTAVVTGAGRGIGRGIAEHLASRGANVILVARSADQLGEVEAAIAGNGAGRARAFACDVRDGSAVESAVRAGESEFGPVTLVVNNAGTGGPAGPWWEAGADEWWECVESIVRGAYNTTRAVLPGMIERVAVRVVGIVSTTGTGPNAWADATSVAKTALIRHVENLAFGTSNAGVKAFALHPGIVRTNLLEGYRSSPAVAAMLDSIPDGAFVTADVAASAVGRIAAGELDAFSGCFLDATSLGSLPLAPTGPDHLKLRISK